jgi:hypothetical protein
MILNPHTGQPMQTQQSQVPNQVYVFNPKVDITVEELAETLMLVLSAQRFALLNVDMLRKETQRHFDVVSNPDGPS